MTFNVISGGREALNAFIYPPPNMEILNYFSNNINRATQLINDYTNTFIDKIKGVYDYFNSNESLENAKLNLYLSERTLREDVVYPIDVNGFSHANLIMQRYIMAHPDIMEINSKNMCHGFSSTYIGYDNMDHPKDNHEYNQTISGVVRFKDGKGYYENIASLGLDGSYKEQDIVDKCFVLETWDNIQIALAKGIDPTELKN